MEPIKMKPAFRHGTQTPWGGTGLTALGKEIPDDRTGESLEISVLPGLESRDETGRTLTEILREGGEAVRGKEVGEAFPLLLKFISARDRLSVQVHPDDRYAGKNEGGKLGKTEAWVVLDAQEGAQIIYGVTPGTTRKALEQACAAGGKALISCLRFVKVHPGEVYYIPSGMLHALGGGITVAEIQESSDVTYRFYDWDRRDENGRGRELHIGKGLDVIRPELQLEARRGRVSFCPAARLTEYIEESAFTLSLLETKEEFVLPSQPERFRLLSALTAGSLSWQGGHMPLVRGDSVFVPADAPAIHAAGGMSLLLMSPGKSK